MPRRDDEEYVEFAAAARTQLRRTAYLISGDWDRASDIVQEALIRVYVAWPRLEKQGGLHAYARRAVVSVAIDMSRKRTNRELPAVPDPSVPSDEDVSELVTARDALMRALRDLPPRQRACVVLRYFEDLPVAEVAQALGCTEGTVKSQTSRALDTLRQTFEDTAHDELVTTGEAQTW